jgi:hypothetical protein
MANTSHAVDTPTTSAADRSRQALVAATALAREGRFAEAIAYATAQNRELRDPQIDYRLVKWRHAAFEATPVPARRDWPPAVEDPFPDASGPPEIAASALTKEMLAAGILHHGGLIVRGLITETEAASLADGITHVFEALDAAKSQASLQETLPWYAPFSINGTDTTIPMRRAVVQKAGAAVWTLDSPRMLFDLIDLFERRGILRMVTEHLGERPVFSVEKATLRLVPSTTGSDWHQDGAFLGADIRAVNVWLALSDCGVDAPGLDLMPRRVPYVVETGTHGAKFDWTVGEEKVILEGRGTPIARPVYRAGDAVLFDQLYLHRTGVRPGMTKDRWAIESWLFAPSTLPAGHHAIVL